MKTTAFRATLITTILALSPLPAIADPQAEEQQESERSQATQEQQALEMIQMLTAIGGSKQPPP
jgi:hypothetical protein